MNAIVTRRALLGATAAIGAVGLSGAASALAVPEEAQHPDADLFVLIDRWGPAQATADTAAQRTDDLWDVFVAQRPERPVALRFSGADGLNCGFEVEDLPDGRRTVFYGFAAVSELLRMPEPRRREETFEPMPGHPGDQIVHTTWVPDERRIARRREVMDAHDAWQTECEALRHRLGVTAANEAWEEADTVLREVEGGILAIVPETMAGLIAKARWASWDGLPKQIAAEWGQRVAADVVAMAERGGWAS